MVKFESTLPVTLARLLVNAIGSLSRILPVPVLVVMTPPIGLDGSTVNDSANSLIVSSTVRTGTDFDVSPGAKVKVPDTEVKSSVCVNLGTIPPTRRLCFGELDRSVRNLLGHRPSPNVSIFA